MLEVALLPLNLAMGGLISLLRDIRTVYKDLKVTLKLTARIVLKVHGIVDDVEHTVQELKAAVKGLSSKINPQDGMGEVAFNALVENVESKATLLKTALIEATSQVFNDDLIRNTQEKWDKVVQYSRESSEVLANIVANSSNYISGQHASERGKAINETVVLSGVKESDKEDEESKDENNRVLVPVFKAPPSTPNKIEEDLLDREFEILPLDIMDSFWKCDIGCFNIDCVDFQQLPSRRQRNSEVGAQLRKKKTKKRDKKSAKFGKKTGARAGATGSVHTPAKYHHNKQKQPREHVALELIFLIALLVEGVAMSNSDLSAARGSTWNECNYGGYSRVAQIIELDD